MSADTKNKNEKIGFYLHISCEDRKIISELKNKYCINVSRAIKNFLVDYHKRLEKGGEK